MAKLIFKFLREVPLFFFFHSTLQYIISPMVLFEAEYKKKCQKCSIMVIYTNAWKTRLARIKLA